MKPFAREKLILPEYPRTPHLPWKPNTERTDLVASEEDVKPLFERGCYIQEKVDGANCGMALVEGNAIIRNREFILCKGYKKDTPAKQQFASVFTWFYQNKEKFERLNELEESVSVFGEWMIAQHGLVYDKLPAWFIAYDLYNYEVGEFLNPKIATAMLEEAGFATVPMLFQGRVESYEQLEALANGPSDFTTLGNREGIYLKFAPSMFVTQRFKMVRESFVRGANWSHEELKRNSLA